MENTQHFHIGDIIKKELARQERTEAWLARKIDCDSGNLNRLLRNEHIAPQYLIAISIALKTDLFSHYSLHIRDGML